MKVVALWLLLAVNALAQEGIVIERFDIDFTKSDGQYVIEEWDNYEVPSVHGQSLWQLNGRYTCPECGWFDYGGHIGATIETGSVPYHDKTNHTYTVPTEIHCLDCGALIPLANNYDEYQQSIETVVENGYTNHIAKLGWAYHFRYTDQVNLYFVLSVPVDWVSDANISDRWYDSYLADAHLTLWVTDKLGGDEVAIAGYCAGELNPTRNNYNAQRYDGERTGIAFYIKDITPADYNPLRKLICVRGTYFIRVNNGEDLAVLGNELKQSFYHFTYTPPD